MTKLLIIVGASAAFLSVPAEAAVFTYKVAGTFTDGSLLSGQFSFDSAGSAFTQFSNVSLTVTGPVTSTATTINQLRYQTAGGSNVPFAIGSVGGATSIRLGFFGTYSSVPAILTAITTSTLTPGVDFFSTVFNNGTIDIGLASGTITNAAAVPEPAAWAMMLVGFAAMGYAMRRRRVAVSFA